MYNIYPGTRQNIQTIYVPISFRWPLPLALFGLNILQIFNGYGPFVFPSCTKTSSGFTLRNPASEKTLPSVGILVYPTTHSLETHLLKRETDAWRRSEGDVNTPKSTSDGLGSTPPLDTCNSTGTTMLSPLVRRWTYPCRSSTSRRPKRSEPPPPDG